MENLEELYHLLCSDGYLPPRNEEELLEQERRYSNYQFENAGKQINPNDIIKGNACKYSNVKMFDNCMASEPLGIAARNFENLPTEIIEKIKKQHNKNNQNNE